MNEIISLIHYFKGEYEVIRSKFSNLVLACCFVLMDTAKKGDFAPRKCRLRKDKHNVDVWNTYNLSAT